MDVATGKGGEDAIMSLHPSRHLVYQALAIVSSRIANETSQGTK